jgi:hypothetical protein
MVRLLIFSLVRFFLFALIFYVVLTVLKGVLRALSGEGKSFTRRSRRYPQQENPPKTTEEYTDVKDAKFIELPDERKDEREDRQT